MKRLRLFWLVFPSYVAITLGLLLLVLLEGEARIRDFHRQSAASSLEADARMFAEMARELLPAGNPSREQAAQIDALAKRLWRAGGIRITVILPSGKVVAESEENPEHMADHRTRPEIAGALEDHEVHWTVRPSPTLGEEFLYVGSPAAARRQARCGGPHGDVAYGDRGDARRPEGADSLGRGRGSDADRGGELAAGPADQPAAGGDDRRGRALWERGPGVPAARDRLEGGRRAGRGDERHGRPVARADRDHRPSARRAGRRAPKHGRRRPHPGQRRPHPRSERRRGGDVPARSGEDPRAVHL